MAAPGGSAAAGLGIGGGWVWSPARWRFGRAAVAGGRRGDLGPRGSRRRAGRVAALRAGGGSVGGGSVPVPGLGRRLGPGAWPWAAGVGGGAVAVVVPPSAVLGAAAVRGFGARAGDDPVARRRPRAGEKQTKNLKGDPNIFCFQALGGFARFGGAPGAAPGGSAAGGPWDRRRLGLVSGAVAVRAVGGSGGWGTVCCGCGRRGDGDRGDLGDLGPRGPRGPRGSRRRAGRAAALRAGGGAVGGGAVGGGAVLVPGCGRRGRGRGPAFGGPEGGGGAGDSWAGFAERERTAGLCSSFYEAPGRLPTTR